MNIMVVLNLDVFLRDGGIFKSTMQALYSCDEFFLQRQEVFTNFFKKCMTNPVTSNEVVENLYGLTSGYHGLYNSLVTKTVGPLEKRNRAGKLMIQKFESSRITLVDEYLKKFSNLSGTQDHLLLLEDETSTVNAYEDSNLLFGFMEQYLYDNYWKWIHSEKGMDVSNFIKERPSDSKYVFTTTMKDKIYDITGYLCGARLSNLLRYNRLRSEYHFVFTEYYTHSRYPNGKMAVTDGLPAGYLLFRQHSEGLYFARAANFDFIKIMQAIYMQCLSIDVLILYNSSEPVKLVHQLILNSKVVQNAFMNSCYILQDKFHGAMNMAEDKTPICYLFQFLVQGFIRVYSKDIYQLRLSNVLLSKTGASGIRTTLLTLSADAQAKKSIVLKNTTTPEGGASSIQPSTLNSCPCGRNFTGKGWLTRHQLSCPKYIALYTPQIPNDIPDRESVELDNLIELEGLQFYGDFDNNADRESATNLESNSDAREISFDSDFVSAIIEEDL